MNPNYSPFGQNDPESPYKGLAPTCCGAKMEDRFRGYANNMPNFEFWYCPRCKTEKPKYTVHPTKPSEVTISFNQPSKSLEPKPVPIDESKYFDPKKARKRS